jgi:glucosyl-3-phosphoglycerate synthase
MEYAQEHIATLHSLTDPTPSAPLAESAVVVPIEGSDPDAVMPQHIFETLDDVDPGTVVVPFRGPERTVAAFRRWVDQFDLSVTVLWCNAPAVEETLAAHGLDGDAGKGLDVWLGLGVAADKASYVAVHDADATTYGDAHVPRLLAPLTEGYGFVKGYYARVENERLYGRLARLLVAPLLDALDASHDDPILSYLGAFRYPLAGEFAFTADIARSVRAQRTWGLEVGLLGDAYTQVGRAGTAQVDLGVHKHDHRPVDGGGGLSTMADDVAGALFRVLRANGLDPDYNQVRAVYRDHAARLVDQYAADASFNGLSYDREAEREQVEAYADSIAPPAVDTRLPAWASVDLSPKEILAAATREATTAEGVSMD